VVPDAVHRCDGQGHYPWTLARSLALKQEFVTCFGDIYVMPDTVNETDSFIERAAPSGLDNRGLFATAVASVLNEGRPPIDVLPTYLEQLRERIAVCAEYLFDSQGLGAGRLRAEPDHGTAAGAARTLAVHGQPAKWMKGDRAADRLTDGRCEPPTVRYYRAAFAWGCALTRSPRVSAASVESSCLACIVVGELYDAGQQIRATIGAGCM